VNISRGEIDRLGNRIRDAGGLLGEDERGLLEQVLSSYLETLERAVEIVERGLYPRAVSPTPRLKSDKTLIEKLLREPKMRLSRVEDIAGMRIVEEITRLQQDELADRIAALFEGSRIIDRRADPRSGYRAVHLRVTLDGRFVEIQVRTTLQNLWAQAYEALGDVWGRGIRYGELPTEPARRSLVETLLRLSEEIAEHEEALAELVEREILLDELGDPGTTEEEESRAAFDQDLGETRGRQEEYARRLRSSLENVTAEVEDIARKEIVD
jgi:ppGpp synthetase/RelA/SpoT-type nucleotidyltranferase